MRSPTYPGWCTRRPVRSAMFVIRDRHGVDFDVIPEELAVVIRQVLGLEMKNPNYSLLLSHKLVRKKRGPMLPTA